MVTSEDLCRVTGIVQIREALCALNNKIDSQSFVTLDTVQSITASKTFTKVITFSDTWSNYQATFGSVGQGGRIQFLRGLDGTNWLKMGYSSATASTSELLASHTFTIRSSGDLTLENNATTGITRVVAAGALGIITFQTQTTNRLRINADGTIIVDKSGTMTSAGYDLDVVGTARVTGGLTLNDATISKGTGGSFVFPAALSVSGSVVASGSFSLFGGGTTESSAVITINSTTKGFAPPRMTAAQRTAISTPAQMLIVGQIDGAGEGIWVNTSTGWKQLAFVP